MGISRSREIISAYRTKSPNCYWTVSYGLTSPIVVSISPSTTRSNLGFAQLSRLVSYVTIRGTRAKPPTVLLVIVVQGIGDIDKNRQRAKKKRKKKEKKKRN